MKLFKTKLDAATIVLIPACIGINYLGKLFASFLKLPLWLDSIGTSIGGCLGGPVIGALCGAANNLIYGFTAGDNTERPAASAWPPKRSSRSPQALMALCRLNPGTLRPEPLPSPFCTLITMTGLP